MSAHGTEKRQRTKRLTVRFNEQENAAIRKMAESHGQTPGALVRSALLNLPPARAARRPKLEEKIVARVLAELGKIGSNLNQLTRYANLGRTLENSLEETLRDLREMRLACLQALGREPDRRPPDSES